MILQDRAGREMTRGIAIPTSTYPHFRLAEIREFLRNGRPRRVTVNGAKKPFER